MDPCWPSEPCNESLALQVPPCPVSQMMPAVPQSCLLPLEGLAQGPCWLSLHTSPAITAFAAGDIQISTLSHLLTDHQCVIVWFPPDLSRFPLFPSSNTPPWKKRDGGSLMRSSHCHTRRSQNLIFIPEIKGLSTRLTAQKTPNKK